MSLADQPAGTINQADSGGSGGGMLALDMLLSRGSAMPSHMQLPPAAAELERILDAATRAADRGWLRPWRFILVSGPARRHLGNLLHGAYERQRPGLDPKTLERVRRYPQRIP